jgi:hypothetical protein
MLDFGVLNELKNDAIFNSEAHIDIHGRIAAVSGMVYMIVLKPHHLQNKNKMSWDISEWFQKQKPKRACKTHFWAFFTNLQVAPPGNRWVAGQNILGFFITQL